MKLPDFLKHEGLNELRRRMGAPLVRWNATLKWDAPDIEKLKSLLSLAGWEVDLKDLLGGDGEPFMTPIGDQPVPVLVYIRDQYARFQDSDSSYRFHLTQCEVLNRMQRIGRFKSRYVATRRTDGRFLVNAHVYGLPPKKDQILELKVCKRCLRKLRYKDYPIKKDQVFQGFSIEEFFKAYDTSFSVRPDHDEYTMPENEYSERQQELSRIYRKNRHWRCEHSNVDFSEAKHLLHLHHIDGRKSNNALSNLKALCVVHHSDMPLHQHLKDSATYTECQQYIRDHSSSS